MRNFIVLVVLILSCFNVCMADADIYIDVEEVVITPNHKIVVEEVISSTGTKPEFELTIISGNSSWFISTNNLLGITTYLYNNCLLIILILGFVLCLFVFRYIQNLKQSHE